jgi:hypothetical protein
MKIWYDAESNFEYRMEIKDNNLLIQNKEPSEAKWHSCCNIPQEVALKAQSLIVDR